jgi:LAS superfamily LD-carboxypeptidase LdcB/serine/threonine protein kinase
MDYSNLCLGCFDDCSGQNPCPSCGYETETLEVSLYLIPGTILSDKYLVGRVLGQGGFGITYLGWDTNLDIRIAIKEFFPQGLVSRLPGENSVISYTGEVREQFTFGVESFLREAKTLAHFEHHPNIVTVRDFFKENNTAYMVMSFIEGVTLLEHLKNSGGKIPVEPAVQIIMPVLDALKEVHRAGIMHRDISPDNIFIDREGRIVLIDFGAARQELREKSKSLSVILKAGYAPEEQYRSKGKQGPWTDIYAVAATMYRSITGQTPLEAIDRMAQDDLQTPLQLGVKINKPLEKTLLKALAVKTEDRYQVVKEFQEALVAASDKGQSAESPFGVGSRVPGKPVRAPQVAPAYSVSKRTVKTAALILLCGLFIFGAVSLFGGGDEAADPAGSGKEEEVQGAVDLNDEGEGLDEALSEEGTEETAQTYDPAVIAALDADYYIDYENGTIPIGDLPIGARVVDPGWEWEFRTGYGYAREEEDQTKPVTWIVVAKDHYEGLEPHVTLLSEELIGRFPFDTRPYAGAKHSDEGHNHWGDSGTYREDVSRMLDLPPRSSLGLRPWLNSTGVHADEGFCRAFSENFKSAVMTTTVPNREWKNGISYCTSDNVFIPSTTELGGTSHSDTYRIGTVYPYFQGAGNAKRGARLDGEVWWYWTRSPDRAFDDRLCGVDSSGEFGYGGALAYLVHDGVRPALNLKSGTMVSEIRNDGLNTDMILIFGQETEINSQDLIVITDGDDLLAPVNKQTTLRPDYEPEDLQPIPLYMKPPREMKLRETALRKLIALWHAAEFDGVALTVISAYRSYDYQKELFQRWVDGHGEEEANLFSARAGQSEHQLGTTVDFGGSAVDLKAEFADTDQGRWLAVNAYRFGFVMSYPQGSEHITGYIFEPWHYRYIGVEAAQEWKKSGVTLTEFLMDKSGYVD